MTKSCVLSLTLAYSPKCQKLLSYLPCECLAWRRHPAQFSSQKSCEKSNKTFSICYLTSRWSSSKLQGLEPLKVSHHLAQFGAHRSSTSKDITFLICHMNSEDHLLKLFCDFMSARILI